MAILTSKFFKARWFPRSERLAQAVQQIRRALGLAGAPSAQPSRQPAPEVGAGASRTQSASAATLVPEVRLRTPVPAALPSLKQALDVLVQPRPAAPARLPSFTEHEFTFADERYAYRLYIPGTAREAGPAPLPLLVMLHGCNQDAADFAQGTAMNNLAEQQACIVLYPEQQAKANAMRCWNWYDTAHQGRDAGEPGMIAALTRQVLNSHNADPARVYIAGLSAGGAMAALVAALYPELFAAVGVHSGIPTGAASDVMSAFSAMRRGAKPAATTEKPDSVTPTIVFHGGADKTVHPENGDQIVSAALAALNASGLPLKKTERAAAGSAGEAADRGVSRTVYHAADGRSYVEYWEVGTGPHAWSGGNSAGSFTDPQGPDASRAMLEFFLQHRKRK